MAPKFLKKTVRTAQAYFSGAEEIKYRLQERYFRTRGIPFDDSFRVLASFTPPDGTVFVDIGANKGQSIHAMRLFHPDTPIVAFEPRGETFRRLQRYTAHQKNLRLIQGGLGESPGRFALYTPVYRGCVFDGLASTVAEEAEDWLNADRLYFFDPSKVEILREEVMLASLDSYGLRPSFLKLDVQGAEEQVLRGGLETIAAHQPLIMAEQSLRSEIEDILSPLGYTAHHYDGRALRFGARGKRNAFFVPPARRPDLGLPVELA